MLDPKIIHKLRMHLIDFSYQDVRSNSVAEIKNKLHEFYNSYNVLVANIGNSNVFRVRKINIGGVHDKVADVWCPPEQFCKSIGRANDVGQSVFYGSFDAHTAISEAKIEVGELFSLAVFYLVALEDYYMTSIIIKESDLIDGYDSEFDMFGVELSKFMVNEFTRNVPEEQEYLYKKSCAIAEILFNIPHKDSIIFPSVKCHDSINIALKAENAYKRLILNDVLTCTIDSNRQLLVHEVKSPTEDGVLQTVKTKFKLPCPLNFKGTKLTFSNLFKNENISSPQEIMSHFLGQQQD